MAKRGTQRSVSRPPRCLAALVGVLALLLPATAGAQAGGHLDLPDAMPGDRLLVSHHTDDGRFELHTIGWNASDRRVLTSGPFDSAGAWSPDGRHVAFHRIQAPDDGLYVVSRDGATTTRLADGGYSPSWSPDSRRLVHGAASEAGPNRPLRIAALDGSSTPVPGTEGGLDPVWSPDGAWIAYHSLDEGLAVVRPDGSERRVVATGASFHHRWSPDSTELVYVAGSIEGSAGAPDSRLMIVRRDGTQARQLTRFTRIIQPQFSPSGRDIAFSARMGEGSLNIYRLELASRTVLQLTDSPAQDLHPTWTAGSYAIAFTRTPSLEHAPGPSDVWWAHPGGGLEQPITDTGSDSAVAFAPGLTIRLAGADRIRTAVELSRTFPAADTVVIARADDHPDALAGAPLAGALDAPVLLTGRDRLHPSLRGELRRLGAEHAYLLGGQGALSAQVEDDLAEAGVDEVTRLHGSDRFHTAARVAAELRRVAGAPDRVFVVEGQHPHPARGWPDALSASGLASLAGEPILLVTRDGLPAATRDAVRASGADRAVIIGGSGAVSMAVQAQLAAHIDGVERVAGADRYETSARVADLAVDAGADSAYPWVATGGNWPDALAAAPAATRDGGVLLLATWPLPTSVEVWFLEAGVRRGVIVGGASAVLPGTRTWIENAMLPHH